MIIFVCREIHQTFHRTNRMAASQEPPQLRKVVGVFALATTVINFSIGAGIYALPATIGAQLGSGAIIGYLLCGLMFAAIIFCYVEIGTRVRRAGGSYAYVEAAFGPYVGFVVNWLFFLGWGVIGDAALMNVVADSLTTVFPVFDHPLMRVSMMALIIGSMVIVNIFDTKTSVRVVSAITVIKLIPLLVIILLGVTHIHTANLRIDKFPPLKAFENSALILFFAFAGFESSLNVSGEIRDPARTIPRGIFAGGLIVLLIYVAIQCVTQGILGEAIGSYGNTPLAAVAQQIMGPVGATVLLISAALSAIGAVDCDILATSRLLFAGAGDGLFPAFLARVHKKFKTPYWAVIVYAVMIFGFSVSGGFKQLAVLASGALLLVYLAVMLALLQLRREKTNSEEKIFNIRGKAVFPFIAIAAIIWVFSNLSKQEFISIVIFIFLVSLAYLGIRKWQSERKVKSI
jgi:APA family basic amino acid/polyamine antiporter